VALLCGAAAGNGAKAAALAGYGKTSAKVTASRLLKKGHIRAALVAERANQVSQVLQTDRIVRAKIMTGDEALERLSLIARADIGQALAPTDPIARLPDAIRLAIKTIRPTAHGRVIELYDVQRAVTDIAKGSGHLRERVDHTHRITLEQALDASRTDGV
jgi:phage terminase small subunit